MWKWIKNLNPFESDNYHPWMREEIESLKRQLENGKAAFNDKADRVEELRAQLARESELVRQYKQDRDDALTELAALRGDCDNAVRNAMDRLPDAPWKDKTATEAVWLLSLALRERAAVPVKVRWDVTPEDAAKMMQHIKTGIRDAYSAWDDLGENYKEDAINAFGKLLPRLAAHAVIDAPAGVPGVEELALVLCETYTSKVAPNRWSDVARAAIAHLRKRPEGLPTRDQMAQIIYKAGWCKSYVWDDNDGGSERNQIYAEADAIFAALAPYLRDPVGWELDVTAKEYADWRLTEFGAGNSVANTQKSLDWLHSHIRPAFECKECAVIRAERDEINKNYMGLVDLLLPYLRAAQAEAAARSALEGNHG